MINVRSRRCEEPGCETWPVFGFVGQRPTRCATHRGESMVDIVTKRCLSSWCGTSVGTKYDGYCFHCYVNLFPDKPVTRNYKTKERAVTDMIRQNLDPSFVAHCLLVFDSTVACSKRRPDAYIDLQTHVLIIEVDEKQHKSYSEDNERSAELYRDFGERPIVMIRFNPDSYKRDGVSHKSSFMYTEKTGQCKIRDAKEWKSRCDVLMGVINDQLRLTFEENRVPGEMLEVIKLFYDS